jgi:hypothetical protein
MSNYDYYFKIQLLGNSTVGKPLIILCYANEHLDNNNLSKIGIDFVLIII